MYQSDIKTDPLFLWSRVCRVDRYQSFTYIAYSKPLPVCIIQLDLIRTQSTVKLYANTEYSETLREHRDSETLREYSVQ